MGIKAKLILILGTVALVVALGAKLGSAVDSLGKEIQGNRAAAMGR